MLTAQDEAVFRQALEDAEDAEIQRQNRIISTAPLPLVALKVPRRGLSRQTVIVGVCLSIALLVGGGVAVVGLM